jgi:hypothetical protein
MNKYEFTCTYKNKLKTYNFCATDLDSAYEKAGRMIIDEYDDLDDISCDILDSACRDNWKTDVIPNLEAENMFLSDIKIINNEE